MPNRHHQRPPPSARRPNDGSLVCYGIVVATGSLLLLAVLAATVSIVKACALAGAVAVVFSAAGCLSRRRAADRAAAPALPTTTTTVAMPAARAGAACGLVGAAIDALPAAFAYARPAGTGTCGGGAEGSSSKHGRRALCPVCLEDVEAGEMVRQLPACAHLFHGECIDMWLHSHATCPLCRCDVSPQPVAVKVTAAAANPPDAALPPPV